MERTSMIDVPDRLTLIQRLEAILVNPAELAAHLSHLPDQAPPFIADDVDVDEMGDLLAQILSDPRRLAVLREDELRRLLHDKLGLTQLAAEIACDGGRTWDSAFGSATTPIAAAPDVEIVWEKIVNSPAPDDESSDSALGQLLQAPPTSYQALLFDEPFDSAVSELNWVNGVPAELADPAKGRAVVSFRLQAYRERGEKHPGRWVLKFDGTSLPAELTMLRVEVSGLKHATASLGFDETPAPATAHGSLYIELTQLGDPTEIFNDGSACSPVSVHIVGSTHDGRQWSHTGLVAAPTLSAATCAMWFEDTKHGRAACERRLIAQVNSSQYGPVRNRELVRDVIIDCVAEVLSQRYRQYNRAGTGPEHIAHRIFASPQGDGGLSLALRRYVSMLRKQSRQPGQITDEMIQTLKDTRNGPTILTPFQMDLERLSEALGTLTPMDAEIIRQRYLTPTPDGGRMSFVQIAHNLGISPGSVRVRAWRALRKLIAWFNRP